DGEVFMTPSPNEKHQRILVNLGFSIHAHAKAHHFGRLYLAPFDVVFGEKTALQPDLLFVSSARAGIIGPEYVLGAPDLVVEILSPYRIPYDRVTKFEQYAKHGVGEYWIIDPVAETVDVYRLAGSRYDLKASLSGDQALETPLLPAWKMSLADLFAA
ncbi:MAG TPA: Uma2 family endonuclease, partial [Terriglobia bacterium]|nr:Uma2 family endonuclease [Terriglobia bacterium]